MLSSTTPLFTLLMAVVLEGKRFSAWSYLAMVPLCSGTAVSTASELNFDLVGALLSVLSVWLRALKATLQGRLLCDEKVDSVTLCYYMAPFNVMLFGLGSAFTEGAAPFRRLLGPEEDSGMLMLSILGSSLLACTFNVANFFMVTHLGAVGSTVVNNAKTPATIALSLLLFGNAVTLRQLSGFGITFFGVWLYGRWSKLPPAATTGSRGSKL
jgi:solute carrier family 35 protein E1